MFKKTAIAITIAAALVLGTAQQGAAFLPLQTEPAWETLTEKQLAELILSRLAIPYDVEEHKRALAVAAFAATLQFAHQNDKCFPVSDLSKVDPYVEIMRYAVHVMDLSKSKADDSPRKPTETLIPEFAASAVRLYCQPAAGKSFDRTATDEGAHRIALATRGCVKYMIDQGASDTEIERYIAAQGLTIEDVRSAGARAE
jgi:hypothetical protein